MLLSWAAVTWPKQRTEFWPCLLKTWQVCKKADYSFILLHKKDIPWRPSCYCLNLYYYLIMTAADMCIGIYLLCIGERDISFRGQYNQHAHQWMMSWQCTVIRVLAVSTSEVRCLWIIEFRFVILFCIFPISLANHRKVSLLLLTFMSVERFVSISQPFGERTLNFRAAFISTALIWLVGGALALIPGLNIFVSNGRFLYLPLHLFSPVWDSKSISPQRDSLNCRSFMLEMTAPLKF